MSEKDGSKFKFIVGVIFNMNNEIGIRNCAYDKDFYFRECVAALITSEVEDKRDLAVAAKMIHQLISQLPDQGRVKVHLNLLNRFISTFSD